MWGSRGEPLERLHGLRRGLQRTEASHLYALPLKLKRRAYRNREGETVRGGLGNSPLRETVNVDTDDD